MNIKLQTAIYEKFGNLSEDELNTKSSRQKMMS